MRWHLPHLFHLQSLRKTRRRQIPSQRIAVAVVKIAFVKTVRAMPMDAVAIRTDHVFVTMIVAPSVVATKRLLKSKHHVIAAETVVFAQTVRVTPMVAVAIRTGRVSATMIVAANVAAPIDNG